MLPIRKYRYSWRNNQPSPNCNSGKGKVDHQIDRKKQMGKGGGAPYMYGGISDEAYKEAVRSFLGEEAKKQKRLGLKETWGVILDNMPQEEEPEWELAGGKTVRDRKEKGNDRFVGALRSRGKMVQKETKRGKTKDGSERKKKRDCREFI